MACIKFDMRRTGAIRCQQMKAKYHIVLAAWFFVAMLASSVLAVPEQSPGANFQPRKKKITVERLKDEYGKPVYHLKFDEPICETLVTEARQKLAKICCDEEIAFEMGEELVVYYFSKGKFLARVIKGPPGKAKSSDSSDYEDEEGK